MDYMAQLGIIACGTRFKRLSEMLYEEARRVYAAAGVKFEPKWFALFSLVSERPLISMSEAASALSLSHVAVSKLARELEHEGLFVIAPCAVDRRRSNLTLSAQGEEMLQRLRPLWALIAEGCRLASDRTSFGLMLALEQLEAAFDHQAISQHVLSRLGDMK